MCTYEELWRGYGGGRGRIWQGGRLMLEGLIAMGASRTQPANAAPTHALSFNRLHRLHPIQHPDSIQLRHRLAEPWRFLLPTDLRPLRDPTFD